MKGRWSKKGEFAEFESEMDVPLLSPRSLSSAWFYFEIRSFLSEIPKLSTTVQINLQIERIYKQQEKM